MTSERTGMRKTVMSETAIGSVLLAKRTGFSPAGRAITIGKIRASPSSSRL